MGLFDALRGRAPGATPPPTGDGALESDAHTGDDARPAAHPAGVDLGGAGPSLTAGPAPVLGADGERLYNPYEGLAAAVDGRGLRGTYRLPAQVRRERWLVVWGGRIVEAGRSWRGAGRGSAAAPNLHGRRRGGRRAAAPVDARGPNWTACASAQRRTPTPPSNNPLPRQPEFLFAEEAAVHRRSWSENLTYYTGAGYLVGAATGGARGAVAALAPPPPTAGAPLPSSGSTRLLVNRVLNGGGRAGRGAANALGALGLFFAASESGLDAAAGGRGPDWAPTLSAGFATGALFRSPRGPRAAAVAGAVGAAASLGLVGLRRLVAAGI